MSPKLKKIAAHFGVRLQRHRTRDHVHQLAKSHGHDCDVWGAYYTDRVIHYSPELPGAAVHEVAHLMETAINHPDLLSEKDYGLASLDADDREVEAERIQVLLMAATSVGSRDWKGILDAFRIMVPLCDHVWNWDDHGADFEPDTLKLLPYRYLDFKPKAVNWIWSEILRDHPETDVSRLQDLIWERMVRSDIKAMLNPLDFEILKVLKGVDVVRPMGRKQEWGVIFDRI